MNSRSIVSVFLLVSLLAACTPQPASMPQSTPVPTATLDLQALETAAPGELFLDPQANLGPISPYIYGSNYGPWTAVPVDMLPVALDSKITVLRWPGGAWGDNNDISHYQLNYFMAFCKKMGIIPTISVRLKNGTPEAAAELVRYANLENNYDIRYWSIGNEPTLFEAEMRQTYDTVRFNREWRDIAEAMKSVDPTIQLMGPELHQWGPSLETTLKDSSGLDWMEEFLKANGDLVDIVTVHRYPLWRDGHNPVTIDDMRNNTPEWTQMVIYLRGLIQGLTGRDLPIAFTEVNSSPTNALQGIATPDSFYNAIWYADVLGRMIQERVFMVNQFVLASRNGGLGLIYGNQIRPTYYIFQMYSHFGTELIHTSSGVANVSIYAAKQADGSLTIMLVNLTDVEQQIPLRSTIPLAGSGELWLFDATHNAQNMGQQALFRDGFLDLPPQSVSLYILGE